MTDDSLIRFDEQAKGPLDGMSLLYVPANASRFAGKAYERGADAVILDLEGAVVPAEKEVAAFEQAEGEGRGAFAFEGAMVDLPVVARAHRLIARTR
jgi:citrate lyase beta subunit